MISFRHGPLDRWWLVGLRLRSVSEVLVSVQFWFSSVWMFCLFRFVSLSKEIGGLLFVVGGLRGEPGSPQASWASIGIHRDPQESTGRSHTHSSIRRSGTLAVEQVHSLGSLRLEIGNTR